MRRSWQSENALPYFPLATATRIWVRICFRCILSFTSDQTVSVWRQDFAKVLAKWKCSWLFFASYCVKDPGPDMCPMQFKFHTRPDVISLASRLCESGNALAYFPLATASVIRIRICFPGSLSLKPYFSLATA